VPPAEPTYAQYRRAFYQAIVAADVWRKLGRDDQVRDCVKLAASILSEAPEDLLAEIKRGARIRGIRRNP
jgi:hypothetical protein